MLIVGAVGGGSGMLLQREEGATLGELIDATGWLPHTTRAALTGLRKKGHAIEKTKPAA
jgi:DNA-binding MarR family transcriptional regulator